MLALAGCATTPDVTQLCGSWASDEMREHWWIDGRDLHGAGRMIRDGVEVQTEALALRSSKSGHVYVATPGDATPTEFAPIDPSAAKYGPAQASPDAIRFSWANYQHDFPQEIHYLLDGDRLTAIVSGPKGQSGWQFQRSAGCGQEPPP